jgi:hypothetical protein
VQLAAPEFHSAARKSRQPFDIFQFGRSQGDNVSIGKIPAIIESSGIAKISRQLELAGKADPFAVVVEAGGFGSVGDRDRTLFWPIRIA